MKLDGNFSTVYVDDRIVLPKGEYYICSTRFLIPFNYVSTEHVPDTVGFKVYSGLTTPLKGLLKDVSIYYESKKKCAQFGATGAMYACPEMNHFIVTGYYLKDPHFDVSTNQGLFVEPQFDEACFDINDAHQLCIVSAELVKTIRDDINSLPQNHSQPLFNAADPLIKSERRNLVRFNAPVHVSVLGTPFDFDRFYHAPGDAYPGNFSFVGGSTSIHVYSAGICLGTNCCIIPWERAVAVAYATKAAAQVNTKRDERLNLADEEPTAKRSCVVQE